LLGDGVVAAVLLKKSKAEGSGMDCHHHGLGVLRSCCRRLYGDPCGSNDAHLNPAVTLDSPSALVLWKIPALRSAQLLGAVVRRGARVVAYLPALEETSDTGLNSA